LLGFVGDELATVSGRERDHVATEVGKPRLDLGIGEASVDLLVQYVDDFDRRALGRADAVPNAPPVAREKLAHSRYGVAFDATKGAFRFVTGSQNKGGYKVKTPYGVIGTRG